MALIVIPVSSPDAVKFVTVNVSIASTSVAPDSRSTVNIAAASVAESTTALETVGASFVPVIMITMSSVVPSMVWTVTVSVVNSPNPSD